MRMPFTRKSAGFGVCVVLCCFGALSFAGAAPFEEQRKVVAASVESQPESAIVSLLQAGLEENMPAPALALAKDWLRRNVPKQPEVLRLAGRAAELSGDWRNAASLYQRSLQLGDPKSPQAGDVIASAYAIWIDLLEDQEAAYAFGLNEAESLAVNPRFRQFDRWFLELAKSRNDRQAVAKRLHATFKSGVSEDYLAAFYANDVRWLLGAIRGVRYDQMNDRFTPEFTSTVKELAKQIRFDKELSLLIDWAVSVKAYNMAMIDGEETEAPLEVAKALLDAFPRHAKRVQDDWAGGHNGQYYRDDPKKYWPDQSDAKMSMILAAVPKLSPLEQADLFRTWASRYYAGGPEIFSPEQARELALSQKEWVNRKTGPKLGFGWEKLTYEDALSLAASLEKNPSPEASIIRALVAGGPSKNLDRMVDALLTKEVWRLGNNELNGAVADRLWHWSGRPEGNKRRDELIARSKKVLESMPKDEANPKAPEAKRMETFRRLWGDYMSNAPKEPGVETRLKAVLAVTHEAAPMLLNHDSVESALLVRSALAAGFKGPDGPLSGEPRAVGLSPNSYAPQIQRVADTHRGMEWLKQNKPELYKKHPLEEPLRKAVEQRLKKNQLEDWLVLSWVNAQFPEDREPSVKLMEQLYQSPAFAKLGHSARYGCRSMFRAAAMPKTRFDLLQSAVPNVVCKEMLEIGEGATADQVAAALKAIVERVPSAPMRVMPVGLDRLANLPVEIFAEDQVYQLCVELADTVRAFVPARGFCEKFFAEVAKRRNPSDLLRTSAYLWQDVSRHHRTYPRMLELAESFLDEQAQVASTLSTCGLNVIDRHKSGHTWFKRETDIPLLKSIRGRAAIKLGLVVIPVSKEHPHYPVYQAQADWLVGNEEAAWNELQPNWEAFSEIYREMSFPFLMWVLDRTAYSRDEAGQEFLIKGLLEWSRAANTSLTDSESAQIEIAYGDIAMLRGQLRQAHEIFKKVQTSEKYAQLEERYVAALRRVRAERMAKNYDSALQTLAELELERVPDIWTDVRFARAEVNYDMEEFEDAKDDIDSILERDPNHPDARILLGKVQLKRKKLMEATEVEIGSAAGEESIVPGESLKVTLSDPTLEVSGAGTETEVTVWATSGDRETFFLRQFGDAKTKFRGEVPTALGAPNEGDGILQVIGDDEVFYGYSKRFLEKMNLTDEKRGGPITIASDAVLMASARKLLTEAEQRAADMQEMMSRIRGTVSESAAKAMWANRAVSDEGDESVENNALKRIDHIAKPGNPIYVRVVDPDRSRTREIDELVVSVSTSSGDSISRVTLKETGTHSGRFEGSVPTTGAQATAFAANSEPGRDPNMVLSPKEDYPAWRPVPEKNKTPEFLIDFNDNLSLGEMTLTSGAPGEAPTAFALQAGMNQQDLTTIAAYPRHQTAIEKPWHPSVIVMNDTDFHHNQNKRSVYDLDELKAQIETGYLTQQFPAGAAGNVAGPSEAMTESIPGKVEWKRQNHHHNAHVVYRFRGYFHEPKNVTRRFKLDLGGYQPPKKLHPSVADAPQFLLAVDGRVITDSEKPNRLEGEINLRPGIHHFEIWATGWDGTIGFGRSVKLRANLDDPEGLVDCPDSFFDPATFPQGSLDHRNAPATLTPTDDGAGFKVKFAEGSRARVIKLVLLDQKSPVPSLKRITLTDGDGTKVLPLAEDFAELNKNDTLEMLTGDRISVRYVDDRYVTKNKEKHERFLDVAFTDARAEFADMEPRFDEQKQEEVPYYERLIRFAYDEPLALAIHDADMDSTVEPDKVQVTIATDAGERKFEATETGDSTGIFKLVITPVAANPSGEFAVQVAEGGAITAIYLDEENDRPGVPTERVARINHAAFRTPELVLSHSTVTPLEDEGVGTGSLYHGFERLLPGLADEDRLASERLRPRWQHEQQMISVANPPEGGFRNVLGEMAYLDVVAPHEALGLSSRISVYVQTDTSRERSQNESAEFDIDAPGTLLLSGRLQYDSRYATEWRGVPLPPIYHTEFEGRHDWNPGLDRFRLAVPLILGMQPSYGALTPEERYELRKQAATTLGAEPIPSSPHGLFVRPGERIHFGFRYQDRDGKTKWATASSGVITHPVMDLMDEEYRENTTSAFVGQDLRIRVVDLGADVTDAPDTVQVAVQSKSGGKQSVVLHESGPHTGIFRTSHTLRYASVPVPEEPKEGDETGEESAPADPVLLGLPVVYGDTIAARYKDANGVKTDTQFVTISKGADGTIEPFSKQYDDPTIAMRTQFSLAEAYLEIARRHRKLGEDEAASQEFETARQLLAKAMDQFTEPETRAHAEYLLGMLTMEDAAVTEDPELQETRYRAALSRFLNITGSYSQTLHASKAQYQIATVYERLKEPEIAAQEYVKLAYKYPDSEYLAVSMARLGTHFLKKAGAYEAKAKPLIAKGEAEEDKDAAFEAEAMMRMAFAEYLKTARIFGRLQERFPGDPLAGQAGLRAGQAYMRAQKNHEAVEAFQRVIREEGYDGKTIRAQAMYWAGMCYQSLREPLAAYSIFKRLTYDFPESEWAAYARGQLSQENMLDLENKLELQRLEAEQ